MAEKKEKERVKIPPEIVSEAMHLSDSTCCKCREPRKAVQTHHIDEDPSNSLDIDNIAVLCLQCHDETMAKGGFGRKFNADLVKKYRDAWYADVQKRRENTIVITQPSVDTYYDDLEDVEFDDKKTRALHKLTRTNFSYLEFKEAIENYLYLNDGDQKVLIKLLKDFLKNGELDIPKIIRKNQNFIIEINNLKNNNFLSFYGGW
ncbi:HNH endonuclease signature motif containing protein [Lysinibacillus sp. 1 U-2021]|uniref:HNH endonuclease signature motif containing protein n=1 Tax=Lysinibacillus sp. 1 U-2021 TaxID=3039426 RepID=UPI002480B5BF|nr:HNH endonuclease signature motif containing protein [Lysinibacillus sp. 1 U-2021]WGT37935.1 HNH endonuclease signature motif containing protein [Lysinibacillus sp. 1 U-2021]